MRIFEPRSLDPDLNFFENGRSGFVCNGYGFATLVLFYIGVLKISGHLTNAVSVLLSVRSYSS
jgi:hypothetical protein